MTSHRYKIGDLVDFTPGRRLFPASANAYTVVRLLPSDGMQNVYRVKCEAELFERIAKESELSHRG